MKSFFPTSFFQEKPFRASTKRPIWYDCLVHTHLALTEICEGYFPRTGSSLGGLDHSNTAKGLSEIKRHPRQEACMKIFQYSIRSNSMFMCVWFKTTFQRHSGIIHLKLSVWYNWKLFQNTNKKDPHFSSSLRQRTQQLLPWTRNSTKTAECASLLLYTLSSSNCLTF